MNAVELLIKELNDEEQHLMGVCSDRLSFLSPLNYDGSNLDSIKKASDHVTSQHVIVLDALDRIDSIERERKAAKTTLETMIQRKREP